MATGGGAHDQEGAQGPADLRGERAAGPKAGEREAGDRPEEVRRGPGQARGDQEGPWLKTSRLDEGDRDRGEETGTEEEGGGRPRPVPEGAAVREQGEVIGY